MTTEQTKKRKARYSDATKLTVLILLFTLICICIFALRSCDAETSEFVDSVAEQIEQEMADNQIVLSKNGGRRTVVEFQEPIILNHGQESRLIVYSVQLNEKISISSKGLGGWDWTSTYKEIEYEGFAEYTVDLSQLSEEDFIVNNELKILTVRIPYAVLSSINIPADKIRFHDVQKGWAAPKDIKMTAEEITQLEIQVNDKMKAKLIDENIIALANEKAKIVVAELLAATVHSIDPEFTVMVVQ